MLPIHNVGMLLDVLYCAELAGDLLSCKGKDWDVVYSDVQFPSMVSERCLLVMGVASMS